MILKSINVRREKTMAITEFAKQYHEKMFPGYESKFLETDPEFMERFDNFAFVRS